MNSVHSHGKFGRARPNLNVRKKRAQMEVTMTNTEWMLVGKAKNGDTHAFARLYETYYTDLYRFAVCLMRSTVAAEDAVSSAVLKAYENLPKLRKNDSFKSWLFQITSNECRTMLKKQSVYLDDTEWTEPEVQEDGYEASEIAELLSLLTEEERLVITLSVFTGYNSREIASVVHKREGSVRSIKSRAFARLRKVVAR